MKKFKLILIFTLSILFSGCAGDVASNNSSNSRGNTTPTPFNVNTSSGANTLNSNIYADSNTGSTSNTSTTNTGNTKPPVQPPATPKPSATPPPEDKKDEGLFSFPPPKVTDAHTVNTAVFMNPNGMPTNLSQVSGKLLDGLKKAGYGDGTYTFFWNDKDEFAVVTAMERIELNGAKFASDNARWVKAAGLPDAHGLGEYFKYLIEGKRVYYRVFAFVITPRRNRQSFTKGTPPDFKTALNWVHSVSGSDTLGDGETTTIESVLFTEKYKCFALLYLFVDHTSLDAPKAIDPMDPNIQKLTQGLSTNAEEHLNNTKINFGG